MLEILPTDRESEVVGHLGPDVLGPDWDPETAIERVLALAAPHRAALLDQRDLAGVGTLWASESLFIERHRSVDPRGRADPGAGPRDSSTGPSTCSTPAATTPSSRAPGCGAGVRRLRPRALGPSVPTLRRHRAGGDDRDLRGGSGRCSTARPAREVWLPTTTAAASGLSAPRVAVRPPTVGPEARRGPVHAASTLPLLPDRRRSDRPWSPEGHRSGVRLRQQHSPAGTGSRTSSRPR